MNHFDFFTGSWSVANRRRTSILTGTDEWTEFPGTSVCHRLLDGVGFSDEMRFPELQTAGVTFGFYDQQAGQWALYWVSAGDGRLQPPVRGTITDGVGEFFGQDSHEGQPIRVRNRMQDIAPDSFTWDQAYSADQGHSWETNWVMQFTRQAYIED